MSTNDSDDGQTDTRGVSRTEPPTLNYRDLNLACDEAGRTRKTIFKSLTWTFLISGALVVVVAFTIFVMAMLQPERKEAKIAKCASNLKNIAVALITYSNAHGGQYPGGIDDVLKEGMTPEVLICPSSGDSPATGTLQEQIAEVAAGHNCSYIYMGKGLTTAESLDTVLAYERPGNHRNGYVNVLFADYHTQVLTKNEAQAMINSIVPGKPLIWPPRSGNPTTQGTGG